MCIKIFYGETLTTNREPDADHDVRLTIPAYLQKFQERKACFEQLLLFIYELRNIKLLSW